MPPIVEACSAVLPQADHMKTMRGKLATQLRGKARHDGSAANTSHPLPVNRPFAQNETTYYIDANPSIAIPHTIDNDAQEARGIASRNGGDL
jgi:hypothetical protein